MKPALSEVPKHLFEFNVEQTRELRKEAESVKSCFTDFFYKSMTIGGAVVSIIAATWIKPELYWPLLYVAAGLFLTVLTYVTARIGTHKYATANRTLGYIQHLSRVVDYSEMPTTVNGTTSGPLSKEDREAIALSLRRINWEEAMFAWRVVQPVIYDVIYGHRSLWFFRREVGEGTKPPTEAYRWHDSRELIERLDAADAHQTDNHSDRWRVLASFHPGLYLKRLEVVLAIQGFLGLVMVGCGLFRWINPSTVWEQALVASLLSAIGGATFCWKLRDVFTRVAMLEHGLLSIQSSAFVWRIVCVSHLLAIKRAHTNPGLYKGYTRALANIAVNEIALNLDDPHAWLMTAETELARKA